MHAALAELLTHRGLPIPTAAVVTAVGATAPGGGDTWWR